MLHCSVNSGVCLHCSVNSVSCYTVQWTVYQPLNWESRKKALFFCFPSACVSHAIYGGTMHSTSLFFVNQTFASCVFDKTQTLTRSQTYYVTRFFIGIYMGHTSSLWHVDTLSWWTLNDYSSIIAIDNTHLFSMYEKYIFYFFEFLLAYYLIKPN
jgi:hypothetical protein